MIDILHLWGVTRKALIGAQAVPIPYKLSINHKDTLPISTWIRNEGKCSTVKRLKNLKIWTTAIISGKTDFSIPWIKKERYRGILVPKYRLFRTLVEAYLSSDWKTVRTLLAYVSSYKLYRPTIGSLESIVSPKKISLDDNYLDKLLMYVDLPRVPKHALEWTKSILKNTAHCRIGGRTEVGPCGFVPVPTFHNGVLQPSELSSPDSIGRLSVVPDKGKARVILIGHFGIQLQTKKLADWLRNYLWTLPEIASGDQSRMMSFVKDRMLKGWKFASIDQSQATDRLSRATQVKVLERMGVPSGYFDFLELPFWYHPKDFGGTGKDLLQAKYGNGQPMGLYISFPMFELLHYICAKYAVASTHTEFSICGDDIVFSAPGEQEVLEASIRYKDIIESLGGVINPLKTITGNVAEAVGGLFVPNGNTVMEIRVPSGSLSRNELSLHSWSADQVRRRTRLGRAIEYSFLSPCVVKRYTYEDRRGFWKWFISSETDLSPVALRDLTQGLSREPQEWSALEDDPERFARAIRPSRSSVLRLRPVSAETLDDARLTTRIKSLYKESNINVSNK